MSEYSPPQSEAQFAHNFAPLHPLMNETQAYYESSRCLYCYDAPCITACPTSIDIPLFIRQIHTGNIKGSAQTIYNSNYLGHACGEVCPTKVLCEGACVYNEQDVKPIEIGRLQAFATGKIIEQNKQLFRPGPDNGKKVAIIGAGPAGISCACELRMLGYAVDIFEAKALPSGLTVYGVAPYKITNEQVLDEVNWLQKQFQFALHYNEPINSKRALLDLESRYDAIFLGIGLGKTKELGIPGASLEGVWGAVEYIEQLRIKKHQALSGKKVVVIGGGNTAMDAASESARMGAEEVHLAYRRGPQDMGAYVFEFDLAKGAGVIGQFFAQPVEILGEVEVKGIRLLKTTLEDGKLATLPGTEFDIACDTVILATGQEKQSSFLDLIEGLSYDARGRISVNESFQTHAPKYFAAGDAVNGGVEVVNAVAEAKKAAAGIHHFLS